MTNGKLCWAAAALSVLAGCPTTGAEEDAAVTSCNRTCQNSVAVGCPEFVLSGCLDVCDSLYEAYPGCRSALDAFYACAERLPASSFRCVGPTAELIPGRACDEQRADVSRCTAAPPPGG